MGNREGKIWEGETCKCCTREQRLAWLVSNDLWNKVVIDYYYNLTLCLECFLRMAEDRGVVITLGDIWFQSVIIEVTPIKGG